MLVDGVAVGDFARATDEEDAWQTDRVRLELETVSVVLTSPVPVVKLVSADAVRFEF